MAVFVVRRLVALVLTLIVASLVVFIVLEVLPGDPAAIILGVNARPDTVAALHRQLGLDHPPLVVYVNWVAGMLRGHFGDSYTYGVPVAELIRERIGVSLPLALLSITISASLAIPLGVFAASHRGSLIDAGTMAFTQLGVALPNFWLGLLLIVLFGVVLGWLPAGGFPGWDAGVVKALRSLILPAVALALPQAAILARITRSSVLETMQEDYVRTARAKGLGRRRALWRHAVPNALIPVVTIMGLQFSYLVAGTIIIENVFTLPGIGRLVFQAIAERDLIVVRDLVVLFAASVVIVNFVVDVLYAMLDPRLRSVGDGA